MTLGTMLEEIRGKHRYATADDIRNVPSARKTVFRWGVPIALGVLIRIAPTPAGLSANAWHYFALFAAVIAAARQLASSGSRSPRFPCLWAKRPQKR